MNTPYAFATRNSRRHQAGLSLIELMVAMTIGLIALAAISQIFMSSRKSYAVNEAVARVQEDARFAVEVLARDIRQAGYGGCGRLDRKLVTFLPRTEDRPDVGFGVDDALVGFGDDWENPSTAVAQVPDTDVIVIRRADERVMHAVGDPNGNPFNVTGNIQGVAEEDLVMISDCTQADIVAVTSSVRPNRQDELVLTHAQGENNTPGADCPSAYARRGDDDANSAADGGNPRVLCGHYAPGTTVMRFVQHSYLVGERDGERGLFRVDAHGDTEELVSNVESLRVLYGLDTEGNRVADTYFPHEEIDAQQWAEVISVRFEIVVGSDPVLPESTETALPVFGNAVQTHAIVDDNRRLRRLATKTVTLRNRAW